MRASFGAVDGAVVNAQSLPFADDSFDVVVANHMLYHVPDPSQAVAELRRVLRDDGVLVAEHERPVAPPRARRDLAGGVRAAQHAALHGGVRDAHRGTHPRRGTSRTSSGAVTTATSSAPMPTTYSRTSCRCHRGSARPTPSSNNSTTCSPTGSRRATASCASRRRPARSCAGCRDRQPPSGASRSTYSRQRVIFPSRTVKACAAP